MHKNLEKII